MKTRLPWILLMLVLAFSASYVVGFRKTPTEVRQLSDAEQIEIIAQRLGLDAGQKAEYVRFRKDMAELESRRMEAQIQRLKGVRERMTYPEPGMRNGFEALGDISSEAQREFMRASATSLRQFMQVLEPAQRERFFNLLIEAQNERLNRWKQISE